MSFIKKGASAFGKLLTVIALAAAFLVGAVGVVYLSLQGEELKVPEIVGKDLVESEKELASLGLRIKKRADRPSSEKPNTILEQLPKAGDTVKTGQMILVVTSKAGLEGEETPATIKKNLDDENDSEKIEELISDKPKKSNKSNTNTNSNKKKSSTTRDVLSNNSNGNSNSNSPNSSDNSNQKNSNAGDKSNKNAAGNSNKSNTNANKSNSNKTPTSTDPRSRRTPQP
jgi:hypothetical protein